MRTRAAVPRGWKRRSAAMAAATAVALGAVACGGDDDGGSADGGGSSGDAAPLKIGTPLGFTGALAAYAPSQKQGIQIAVEEINAAGPPAGRQLEVVEKDTESEESVAIQTFEELVRSDGVDAIVGPTSSAEAFAADPVADDAGVPVVAPANTAEGIPQIGDCVFRTSAEETQVIPGAITTAVADQGIESAAVIYASSDEFNETGGKTMISAFEEEGVDVTGSATFATGETNFQAQLTQLLRGNPDALAVAAYTPEAILIVEQARRLGFDGPIVGNKGFSGSGVIDEVGQAGGTLIVGAQYHANAPTTGNEEFVAAYQEEFGEEPDEFAALAYDAIKLIAAGAENAGADADPRQLCEGIAEVETIDGVTGMLTFDDEGDVSTEGVALLSVDGAPFELIEGS